MHLIRRLSLSLSPSFSHGPWVLYVLPSLPSNALRCCAAALLPSSYLLSDPQDWNCPPPLFPSSLVMFGWRRDGVQPSLQSNHSAHGCGCGSEDRQKTEQIILLGCLQDQYGIRVTQRRTSNERSGRAQANLSQIEVVARRGWTACCIFQGFCTLRCSHCTICSLLN